MASGAAVTSTLTTIVEGELVSVHVMVTVVVYPLFQDSVTMTGISLEERPTATVCVKSPSETERVYVVAFVQTRCSMEMTVTISLLVIMTVRAGVGTSTMTDSVMSPDLVGAVEVVVIESVHVLVVVTVTGMTVPVRSPDFVETVEVLVNGQIHVEEVVSVTGPVKVGTSMITVSVKSPGLVGTAEVVVNVPVHAFVFVTVLGDSIYLLVSCANSMLSNKKIIKSKVSMKIMKSITPLFQF